MAHKTRIGSAALIGAAVLCSAALGTATLPGAARAADPVTLRVVPNSDIKVLDPVATTASITLQHAYLIYDTLFAIDDKGEVRPQMVETHSVSPDGRTYTMVLRPGLKFHDGSAVRPADVIASIKRWAARDIGAKKLVDLGMTLSSPDARTVVMELKQPWGLVLDTLGKSASSLFIMREKEAATDPSVMVTETVGSGPFRFVREEWVPGSKVVYAKNPDYVARTEAPSLYAGGKVAKVDRIEWAIIPDQNTAVAAIGAGEIDILDFTAVDLVPVLRKNPNVKIVVNNTFGIQTFIRPNHLNPPFDKPKAREALLHMTAQEDFMRSGIGDQEFWKTCWAWLACGTAMGSEAGTEDLRKPDLAKARALLKEAGYAGEKVVVLQPTDLQVLRDFTEVLVQRLREVGVNVEAQAMDWATLTTRRAKMDPIAQGGWSLFVTGSSGQDVGSLLNNNFLSAACDRSGWVGWACDPEMEQLRDAWASEADLAKRRAIAEKAQARARTFVHSAPIGTYYTPVTLRSNIQGLVPVPYMVFWNVEKRG